MKFKRMYATLLAYCTNVDFPEGGAIDAGKMSL